MSTGCSASAATQQRRSSLKPSPQPCTRGPARRAASVLRGRRGTGTSSAPRVGLMAAYDGSRPARRHRQLRDTAAQLRQPPLEKPPLRLLPRERERALVGRARVRRSGRAAGTAPRARRAPGGSPADRRARGWRRSAQAGRRAVAHRHRDRAVQLDHRRGIRCAQHVVEPDDLRPVGRARVGRLACTAAIAA